MKPYLVLFGALVLSACGKEERQLSPEEQAHRDFVELAMELKEPVASSLECHKVGEAMKPWLKANGARFQELAAQVTKLEGSNYERYDWIERQLKEVAGRCVHPKKINGFSMPTMVHDETVAEVIGMMPKMTLGFEMK